MSKSSRNNRKIVVLFASYEVEPFYKRGGLGDVAASLPPALRELGIDIRIVMPYYKRIQSNHQQKEIGQFSLTYDGKDERVTIYEGRLPETKCPVYFLGNHRVISVINLKRKSIDEFAFFDLAIAGFLSWLETHGAFNPAIVHCNDWHTGLVPLLLKTRLHSRIKSLLTIHNLAYQGKGSLSVLGKIGIEREDRSIQAKGKELNALGEGIVYADAVSTVSPTYAREIADIRRKRRSIASYLRLRNKTVQRHRQVIGILNGINTKEWNPQTDRFLRYSYNERTVAEGKTKNKQALLLSLGFPKQTVLFGFIGRFAEQKGVDLIRQIAPEVSEFPIGIVLLGSAVVKRSRVQAKSLEEKYPSAFRVHTSYDEGFAHMLYGSCDFLLIPSHFEPCGLVQMIAMRYGTVPVASDTGGLHDTISEGKTGLLFKTNSASAFLHAVKRACDVFRDESRYASLRSAGMRTSFSWEKSARKYKALYEDLLRDN